MKDEDIKDGLSDVLRIQISSKDFVLTVMKLRD